LEGYWGNESGDPAKVAQIVLKVADAEKLPPHILLGSDALQYARQAEQARTADADRWQAISGFSFLTLRHRELGFEIPRPFLRRFKRWKYRLHPAIDLQAKALGHHKVSACDVAGLRLVRHRQRLFHGNSWVAPSLCNHCPPR
jgi:hypothetical protein